MRQATPKRVWDVVIVDATGRPADHSHLLRIELVRRGLRVKLDIVPARSVSSLPEDVLDDTGQTAYCVVLMTEHEEAKERPGVPIEVTGYVAMPAPRYPGQSPVFARPGSEAPAGSIETGRIRGDVAALAGRIAERLRVR